MMYHGRAVESADIVGRLAAILRTQWDPNGVVREALSERDSFYDAQALVIAGMLSAAARDLEVQRYLRQLEQQALPKTLHPIEARRAIAVELWHAVR